MSDIDDYDQRFDQGHDDMGVDDFNSSDDEDLETPDPGDNEEAENINKFEDVREISDILTENCLISYACGKLDFIENETIYWSPIILEVLQHVAKNNDNKLVESQLLLKNEIILVMLELMLDVPIVLNLKYRSVPNALIDINNKNTYIDYKGKLFIEAARISKELIDNKILKTTDFRKVPFRGGEETTINIALE